MSLKPFNFPLQKCLKLKNLKLQCNANLQWRPHSRLSIKYSFEKQNCPRLNLFSELKHLSPSQKHDKGHGYPYLHRSAIKFLSAVFKQIHVKCLPQNSKKSTLPRHKRVKKGSERERVPKGLLFMIIQGPFCFIVLWLFLCPLKVALITTIWSNRSQLQKNATFSFLSAVCAF